jgi:carbon monoxide dehydrogenase subunit G
MRLENELAVAAPPERVWRALLDVPRIVRALPGARVEPGGEAGLYRGEMTVKLGPVSMRYEGTARLQEADEDERVAVFHVKGREARGQGSASATITNRVESAEGATRVHVETDLNVSGRAAQLGRGLMEDVSARLLEQFARGLERELAGEPTEARAEPREALDLGGATWGALARRLAVPVLIATVLALVLYARRRVTVMVVRR